MTMHHTASAACNADAGTKPIPVMPWLNLNQTNSTVAERL